MGTISDIQALEILDSRGYPTIMATVSLVDGTTGTAKVPSGASTGVHEAVELRDQASRYQGKGVQKAIEGIHNEIRPLLLGQDPHIQGEIDGLLCRLDNTPNKSRLGANAILAVSLAVSRAAAQYNRQAYYDYIHQMYRLMDHDLPTRSPVPSMILPTPMMNVINGGVHADNPLDIQEFMIVPLGAPSWKEALRFGAEVFYALKKILKSKGLQTAVGDEGGFAPDLQNTRVVLDLLCLAIETVGFKPGREIALALDLASSAFYDQGQYRLSSENQIFDRAHWVDYLADCIDQYPIVSLEDAMAEDDYEGWQHLTQRLGQRVQLVGDDLFVTDAKRLAHGVTSAMANAILIKPNQIGTLTETIGSVILAQKNSYGVIISHRSGETEDTTIADLAVGLCAQQIKTGSLSRSDRLAKYNRLLEIESESLIQNGTGLAYAGIGPLRRFYS
jgi:enolase